ncbi:uncharacterized protein LOC135924411 [Gordionus sp. m RMFG-2023]|uniref:uncharacterized protein LOC135924411 n=1 Tax=Gordionus sp. m RMFG-2023 TaxID=3053472 RepID=UPI0031FCE0EE
MKPYLDDDKSYFHNLVNYTDSEDSDEFENNSNSIREDCISPDPVDFENNSNSCREDCMTPDPVDFENNSNSIREDCITPDPDDFENCNTSIREDCISLDPVDFENYSNSIREDYLSPDPAECEKYPKSVQKYCPSPDLATEDDTIRKHINAIKKIRKISKEGLLVQATKMKRGSDKKLKPGEIGDSVLMPIPPVDQGRLDHKMLLGNSVFKFVNVVYSMNILSKLLYI